MVKGIIYTVVLLGLLMANPPVGYCRKVRPDLEAKLKVLDQQTRDAQKAQDTQVRNLQKSIKKGWTPTQVSAQLGPPEIRQTSTQGSDAIEIWGYDGFEILIQFRNGLVEQWFFRFL